MGGTNLFGDRDDRVPARKQPRTQGEGELRLVKAERHQGQLVPATLDQAIANDHRARTLWSLVEQLDLSEFYAQITVRTDTVGRPATDPKILVALWLYATCEGVGSARQLARLCEQHDAYRWICGGAPVNHHMLSDFRVGHEKALDAVMTQVIAVLMHGGVVKLERVAQDGMRVRASAGAASFRRERSLRKCLQAAREQVKLTKKLLDAEDETRETNQRAAKQRAAREREEHVRRALAELQRARGSKETKQQKENARASTTDAEARVMHMSDGGFRPAYNIQLATDVKSRVILGVRATNRGNDYGQIAPMLKDIERRTGRKPRQLLVDGGYRDLDEIATAGSVGVQVFAPVSVPRAPNIDPYRPKAKDSAPVAAWRRRMGTQSARSIYKQRASTAETVNADLRVRRGLDRLPVRGLKKVFCITLWAALAYNMMRWSEMLPIG